MNSPSVCPKCQAPHRCEQRRPRPAFLTFAAGAVLATGLWFVADYAAGVRHRGDRPAGPEAPPAAVAASRGAVFETPPAPPRPRGVLQAVPPKFAGSDESRLPGYVDPGMTFASGTGTLPVLLDREAAGDLIISRLHYSIQSSVPRKDNPRYADTMKVLLWVPAYSGLFSRTTVESVRKDGTALVKSTVPLPDGVYCMHTGEFRRGAPAPSFAAPFVIGGVSEFSIGAAKAVITGPDVTLSLELINEGKGAFPYGSLVITLQKEAAAGDKPQFIARWNELLPVVNAGGKKIYMKTLPAASWKPGKYHLAGHAGEQGVYDDTDKIADFVSNTFEIPERHL